MNKHTLNWLKAKQNILHKFWRFWCELLFVSFYTKRKENCFSVWEDFESSLKRVVQKLATRKDTREEDIFNIFLNKYINKNQVIIKKARSDQINNKKLKMLAMSSLMMPVPAMLGSQLVHKPPEAKLLAIHSAHQQTQQTPQHNYQQNSYQHPQQQQQSKPGSVCHPLNQ